VVELVFDPRPFLLVHVAVNHENLVGPRLVLHVLEEVVKRVSVLREQEELLVRLLLEKLGDEPPDLLSLGVDRQILRQRDEITERIDLLLELFVGAGDGQAGDFVLRVLLVVLVSRSSPSR